MRRNLRLLLVCTCLSLLLCFTPKSVSLGVKVSCYAIVIQQQINVIQIQYITS